MKHYIFGKLCFILYSAQRYVEKYALYGDIVSLYHEGHLNRMSARAKLAWHTWWALNRAHKFCHARSGLRAA